jgi:hypothetical protein
MNNYTCVIIQMVDTSERVKEFAVYVLNELKIKDVGDLSVRYKNFIKDLPREKLFRLISNCSEEGVSDIVDAFKTFKDDYEKLVINNGGGWTRFDFAFAKTYKVVTVKNNGTIRYSWVQTDREERCITKEMNEYIASDDYVICSSLYSTKRDATRIRLIKLYGKQSKKIESRTIGQNVRKELKDMPCVILGTTSNTEIDHKNGRYNNPRVNNTKTQTVDDFQVLTKNCNDTKRQACKNCKNSGKRYKASNIPSLKHFKIDFVEGTEDYIESPDGCVGCYWYDIEDFYRVACSSN